MSEAAVGERDVEKGQRDAPQEGGEHLCIVCEDNPVSVRLACGHAIMCEGCTKRLLEGGTNQCPSCRAAFTEYFQLDASQVGRQSSFINPTNEGTSFGTLVRATLSNPGGSTIRNAQQQARQNPGCCTVVVVVVVVVLAVLASLLPLALGITEIKLGFDGRDVPCDKPVSPWLIVMGGLHLLLWSSNLRKRERGASNSQQERPSAWNRFLQSALMVAFFVGCFFVYPIRKSDCDDVMYSYAWHFLTITLSFSAFLLLMFFCVCLAARAEH